VNAEIVSDGVGSGLAPVLPNSVLAASGHFQRLDGGSLSASHPKGSRNVYSGQLQHTSMPASFKGKSWTASDTENIELGFSLGLMAH
jgi:hypothetical protein